jgi:hypothetical protein
MSTRTAITLGTLVALGFAIVIGIKMIGPSYDDPHVVAVTAAPALTLPNSATPAADAAPTATSAAIASSPAEATSPHNSLGEANGNIHFARLPSGKEGGGAHIDLQVRSALGVWQPGENLMRILLLESAPAQDQVAQLVSAVRSGALEQLGPRRALIELRFVPSAQAFDRNELDSATLIASDGKLSSTADALAGLDWSGSLPSPQLTLPPGSERPTVELTSGGNTETADRATWKQKWHLSLAVPVVMSPVSNH